MKPIQQFAKAIPLTVLVFTAQILAADKSRAQNERCFGFGDFQSVSLTDWEGGLASWTAGTYSVANPDTFDTPDWAAVDDLPDGRAGRAAFVANLDLGDCPSDDETGVLTLKSPQITIPPGTEVPRISIDHWFQTEFGWDGGNIKISVNGGPFNLLPASAFELVPYSDVLFAATNVFGLYNTNPLAGQPAYTGTLNNQPSGSWAQSRINLSELVQEGDTIELRIDFGVDGCFGEVGWYVDDVEVYSCEEAGGARLTLVNDVINDSGGTATASDWTLTASGPTGFSGSGPFVTSGTDFMAGRYDLSESGGPAGYTASDWFCDGGTQNDADTITLGQGESATCTITNDDVISGFQINAGHSGAWFNTATSGQGQLIDIEPESHYMFLSWFTFTDATSADPNEQHWFTAQGNYSGDTADLVIYEILGGQFDDPQEVSTNPVGEATLSFTDCGHGQMSYTIDTWDRQGSFPLQRAIPGTENVCEDRAGLTTEPLDQNDGRDGAWFDAASPGQGFLIDAHPDEEGDDFIFVAWFTYGENTASGQRWLTAQGPLEGSTANIIVYETVGGSFDEPITDESNPVGSMTIDFNDCSNALLTYSITDEALTGMIDIERAIPGTQALCIELAEQNQ